MHSIPLQYNTFKIKWKNGLVSQHISENSSNTVLQEKLCNTEYVLRVLKGLDMHLVRNSCKLICKKKSLLPSNPQQLDPAIFTGEAGTQHTQKALPTAVTSFQL